MSRRAPPVGLGAGLGGTAFFAAAFLAGAFFAGAFFAGAFLAGPFAGAAAFLAGCFSRVRLRPDHAVLLCRAASSHVKNPTTSAALPGILGAHG